MGGAAINVMPPAAGIVDKGNHRHFMAKEIYEQPEVVGHTISRYIDASGPASIFRPRIAPCSQARRG